MPVREHLEPVELALLLKLADLDAHRASPLARVAQATPCSVDSDGRRLAQRALILDGSEARVNTAFVGVLEAAARPDEVLTLQVSGPQQPGFSLCRRGEFWTECTVGPLGVVKLEYPLSRAAMIVAAGSALSGTKDEEPPLGFRFLGRGADLLVLQALVAAGAEGVADADLGQVVRANLEGRDGAAVSAGIADPGGLRALVEDGDAAASSAAETLVDQGLLTSEGGRLVASRAARAALRHRATAGFVASRTVVDGEQVRASAVQVWRAGGRNLVVRPTAEGGGYELDARDIGRAELRALIAAVFSDEETLARATAAGTS